MKKQPHIIYIITKLELGGAQKICLALFNNADPSCTSLISGTKGPLTELVKDKQNVYLLPQLTREISFFGVFNELSALWAITQKLRQLKRMHGNVIVHTHSTKAGLLGRWAAFFAGIQTRIHTVHGYYAFHENQNIIIWTITYLCELITSFVTTHYVCTTSHDVEEGIRLLPHFSSRHSIIRPAVSVEQFIPAHQAASFPQEKELFVFGCVACFKPQKNIFDLLQAFRLVHIHNPKTRLELIGDGALRPAIEDWIQAHQLTEVITLHGWQDNVAAIMSSWHAFVLSSLWEGICMAIVEARLLKLPILSYNTGGIKDVVIHGKNGFLYPQKQWQQLSHGMLALSTNALLHTKLQSHADNLNEFYIEDMIDRHRKLYQLIK
ncbi:MAG: glycosyltransferase [Candidatus Babeliales bacterium]